MITKKHLVLAGIAGFAISYFVAALELKLAIKSLTKPSRYTIKRKEKKVLPGHLLWSSKSFLS